MQELINRVANSSLITINLEKDFPNEVFHDFDMREYLFHGLILKEKDFRSALKEINWDQYEGAILCVFCSTDAIIPHWAYMLVASYAKPVVKNIHFGSQKDYIEAYYRDILRSRDYSKYEGERIVIKGCSDKAVPVSAFMDLTAHLQPFAQSIMYGEPCSTVPVFKRARKLNK